MSYAPIGSEPAVNFRDHNQPSPIAPKLFRKPIRSAKNGSVSERRNRSGSEYPIIVHCHLCWDWVWQRPQQFLSRLSERHKIIFVETFAPDPGLAAPLARFRTPENFPNITILSLQFPSWRWADSEYVDKARQRLVQEFLAGPMSGQFDNPVQWFYDPMAVPAFAGQMGEVLTVYDCMDELSKFRCAPPEITQREADLLERAEVVFTGGRKLFESKRRANNNCHFYGCGVDWEHFGRALEPGTAVAPELAALQRPVLGYFGVVDERIDYDLLCKLADANPNWSVAMVGPALKIQDKDLPQRPNLHWLGQRAYADLPSFCKGFDLCLMPFALNEATEFINPTKALEYMATGRMIVSTAVADVVRNFGSVVKIAGSPEEFISLCRQALNTPEQDTIQRGLQMAKENSWESIVAQLEKHIEEALVKKRATGVHA